MGLGGLLAGGADATTQRAGRSSPATCMALRVKHVGEYGEHAVAKKAGLRQGDIVVAFDGRSTAHDRDGAPGLRPPAEAARRRGDVIVLRDGGRKTMKFALQ